MSTVAEIEKAIEALPPEQWGEKAPDFLARQRALFGGRELPDSQTALDELRGTME